MAEKGSMSGFLQKDTAGLPNWAWLLVIGAGVAAAYIVPKYFGSKGADQASTGTGTGQAGGGIGLAVDPTTGLPYAVEGLVPSGGVSNPPPILSNPPPTGTTTGTGTNSGGGNTYNPFSPLYGNSSPKGFNSAFGTFFQGPDAQWWTLVPGPDGRVWGVPGKVSDKNTLLNMPIAQGKKTLLYAPASNLATNKSTYINASTWPNPLQSLDDIARKYNVSPHRLALLNPDLVEGTIEPGQKVRVA